MAMEDPFFVVKDEVLKALLRTRSLFEQWKAAEEGAQMARSQEEREWSATELRNAIRSIEWDLEDLEDTVQIVEKNPAKFRIDPTELSVRKSFISQTREEVKRMKARTAMETSSNDGDGTYDHFPIPHDNGVSTTNNGKYSRLPTATDLDSPSHISGSSSSSHLLQHQQKLIHQQDTQINIMSESVGNIRDMSHQIGSELDEQAVMLDEFGAEIENAETKLDATMRKMSKVLHMSNDRRQWMAIGALSSTALVLLLLILAF